MEDQIRSKTLDLTWVPDGMDPIALTCSTPPTVTSAIFTGEMSGSSNPAQVPSSCSSLDPPSSGSRSLHHEMKEAFDPPTSVSTTPPEIEGGTSSCMRNNIRKDVVAERDSISSYKPYMYPDDSMKLKEDAHFLSHTKMAVSLMDHQAQSLESNYAIDIGSHAYLKDAISPQSEYDRQQSYFSSLSSCSLENSSSLETGPSSPDASVHVLAKIRSNISGPKTDCVASYPTTDHQLRRSYPEYHSEHQYSRSDRCAAFSNCTGQSSEHRDEVVDLPRGAHCVDETTSFSSRWSFDDGEPSLPRGLPYGHEIPSLSTQRCNANKALSPSSKWQYGAEISSLSHRQCYGDEILSLPTQKCKGISHSSQWLDGAEIPSFSSRQSYGDEIPSLSSRQYISRSSQWQYGGQIPSLTSKQSYGDEIPSLSRRWSYQDKIPLYSGQRCHDAEAHRSRNYQQGASHGHGHSRNNYVSSFVSNQQVYMTASKHAVTRPRVANRVVNGTDRCIISKKKNPWRNSEDIRDQVCGPRAIKLNNASTLTTKKDILSPLVSRDQFNRSDFSVQYEHAKFFMIKSYSEDDIHKGIKYNVWASTPNGNNKLDAAFHEAQILMKEKGTECPVFLFFSVNTSGQFVGMAEMLGPVDFKKTMDFWRQDKWNGFFPVIWHIIKDIPNRLFKHITLENNDNRPVTFSRDTQEEAIEGFPQIEILVVEGSNCIRGTGGYKKVIRETHRPINRIGLIEEFGIVQAISEMCRIPSASTEILVIQLHMVAHRSNALQHGSGTYLYYLISSIGLPQGLELLKIFKAYHHETSILDDFDFYEEKENTRCAQKGLNVDSLHEARLSCFGTNDFKSMGNLEAGMESMSFETWD